MIKIKDSYPKVKSWLKLRDSYPKVKSWLKLFKPKVASSEQFFRNDLQNTIISNKKLKRRR